MGREIKIDRRALRAAVGSLAVWRSRSFAAPTGGRWVRPGEAGWPTQREWTALGRTLSTPLIRPTPLLSPCVANDVTSEVCQSRLRDLRNPYFLGDQAGGTQVSGWFEAWTPQLSAYAVLAQTSRDVAKAVEFARHHKVRLVVKGGGHSYQGTSNAPDSLLIWTRRMRRIELHDDFRPTGAATGMGPAVSVGAGCMWLDVYDAVTTKAGRYVQGGGCATVGVAGLVQSGGFGSFSKRFGIACASLVEAEVVTADGQVRRVNANQDPELFWALKGGGGGTFGIITRLTLRTHSLPQWFGSANATIRAQTDESFVRLVSRFLQFYFERLHGPAWGESVKLRPDNRLEISLVQSGLDRQACEQLWNDFFRTVGADHELSFEDAPRIAVRLARSWWDVDTRERQGSSAFVRDTRAEAEPGHAWWSGDQEQVSAFLHGYESVWLPAPLLLPDARATLASALVAASRKLPVQLHFNKGLSGAPPDVLAAASDTAMNPCVLDAFALAIVAAGGAPAFTELGQVIDADVARRNAQAVKAAAAELRRIAPEAGSYLSESDYFNVRWRSDYWGQNHGRLERIKRRYDPSNLFVVHHGVTE